MGADIYDIKSGMFLVIVFIVDLDANGLYHSMANGASSICRSVYILDREWILQDS